MASEDFTRRTGDCRVKLSPDMLQRLESLADSYGMPTATLAAFAIAEWVNQKETNARNAKIAIVEAARKMGVDMSQIEVTPEFMAEAQALMQRNLSLDGAVAKGNEA